MTEVENISVRSRCARTITRIGIMCLLAFTSGVYASTVPWQGHADYRLAEGAGGIDEDLAGPFSGYELARAGVVLLEPLNNSVFGAFTVGDQYTGYFQSYINNHVNIATESVISPNLNARGKGDGYELTVTSWFTQSVASVDNAGNPTFDIINGEVFLFSDTTPDRNFAADTGFSDGDLILKGTIGEGSSSYRTHRNAGDLEFDMSVGNLDFNQAVYEPDTIIGGTGGFSVKIQANNFSSDAISVLGHTKESNDLLLKADGQLDLLSVPVPAAVWLFLTGFVGIAAVSRRRV